MAFDLISSVSTILPSRKQKNALKGSKKVFDTESEESDNDDLEMDINEG